MKNLFLSFLLLTALSMNASFAGPVNDIVQDAVIVQQLDAGVLDTSVTGLNGSAGALVTVVAALAQDTALCRVNDTTGKYIGVYSGASLVFVITPGMDGTIRCPIAAGAVVKMRSMQAAGVAAGNVVVQFMK